MKLLNKFNQEKISKTKKDTEVYEIDINKLKEQNDQMKTNINELNFKYLR